MLENSSLGAILCDLRLGLEKVFVTTSNLDCLAAGGLDRPTSFFNFSTNLLEEEVKPIQHKAKLEIRVKVKEFNARNNQ